MKLLRIFLSVLIIALIFSAYSKGYAQELPAGLTTYSNQGLTDPYTNTSFGTPSDTRIPFGEKSISNVTWVTIHELANAFSYYSLSAQPLVYFPSTGELVTIYRGTVDVNSLEPNYQGTNTLNNLFVSVSNDFGITWSDPVLIYDSKEWNFGNARYPSISPLEFEGETIFIISSPLTQGTGWVGTVDGVYAEGGLIPFPTGVYESPSEREYTWGTASNIVSKLGGDGNPLFVVSSSLYPNTASEDPVENNLMGIRKGIEISTVYPIFPQEWSVEKYAELSDWWSRQTEAELKAKNIRTLAMNYLPDGTIAQAFIGNFSADSYDEFVPAFSFSTDDGETWTEFNIMPYSLVKDYMSSIGADVDSLNLTVSNSFVNHTSGALSLAAIVNDAGTFISPGEDIGRVIEIIYQDGEWVILEIAEVDNLLIIAHRLWNNETSTWDITNQTRNELQIASTLDKEYMLVKWVEVIDVSIPEVPDASISTDIFVAGKAMSSEKWGPKVNITNDEKMDRITWMPNIIPNDMIDIPILEVVAKPDESLSAANAWELQFRLTGTSEVPHQQNVNVGHFSYSTVDIESEEVDYGNLDITGIYPNPARDDIQISFNLSGSSSYELELYDLLGTRIETIREGLLVRGFHSVSFNISSIPTGAYYIVLSADGQKITEKLNVIR